MTRSPWDDVLAIISGEMHKKPDGMKEYEFVYYTYTVGLPDTLLCVANYEITDESFDAYGGSGVLETQSCIGINIKNIEVWHKGELVIPNDLEPGLEKLIEKEALELIQDL